MEKIGNKIRKIRELKNYTQKYMADQLGISQKAYSNIENDETDLSISRLSQIALILDLEIADILNFDKKDILKGHYNIQRGNNNTFRIDPIEKIEELYERLLQIKEQEIIFLKKSIK
jgi:transcriptional regulator with XRE-family HTH domain